MSHFNYNKLYAIFAYILLTLGYIAKSWSKTTTDRLVLNKRGDVQITVCFRYNYCRDCDVATTLGSSISKSLSFLV